MDHTIELQPRPDQEAISEVYMQGDPVGIATTEPADIIVTKLEAATQGTFIVLELVDGKSAYIRPERVAAVLPYRDQEEDDD